MLIYHTCRVIAVKHAKISIWRESSTEKDHIWFLLPNEWLVVSLFYAVNNSLCLLYQPSEYGSMDDLAHMLTDPLGTREESNGQITEECMLGNSCVSLPEDLLEDVSYYMWSNLSFVDNMMTTFCSDVVNGLHSYSAFTIASHSPIHPPTAVPTMQGNNQHVRSS